MTETQDIVARLRTMGFLMPTCAEAADEIERLSDALACSEQSEAELKQACGDLDLEIERLRAELKEAVVAERERIAAALDNEADMTPCAEDAMVVRNCANLVRADFDHERAEAIAATEENAHD